MFAFSAEHGRDFYFEPSCLAVFSTQRSVRNRHSVMPNSKQILVVFDTGIPVTARVRSPTRPGKTSVIMAQRDSNHHIVQPKHTSYDTFDQFSLD